jgi:hypothetical protein
VKIDIIKYKLKWIDNQKIAINMPKNKSSDTKQKLQQALDLLKFVLTLDDEEITKSTIEAVIEILSEEISK